MVNLEAILMSPAVIVFLLSGFITVIVWLTRLEAKNNSTKEDLSSFKASVKEEIAEVKLDAKDHKDSASERSEKIYAKIETLQYDIHKIAQSTARIEGKFEHLKD